MTSAPLRIGYLVQQFLPEVGAGPARASEMAVRWKAAGADVTIITGMPNRPQGRIYDGYRGRLFLQENWQGIRVLRSWLFASPKHGFTRTIANNTSFMATSTLHALLRARSLDVLIASSPPFFPHIAGAALARLMRVPLVLEIRDLWPDYMVQMGTVKSRVVQRGLFALERALLRDAARVVVVTEPFRQRVAGKGVPLDRIDVISNGVDASQYYPATEPPPFPELSKRPARITLGYLGNIGAGQGLQTVLDAAALLEREHVGANIIIAGDGPERLNIERRAQSLGLTSVVIKPPITKDLTRAFYNACDVCLVPMAPLPILTETVPSKLFEILACGRPVIGSVAGEGARVIERSGAGWVTPPGEARALADMIIAVAAISPAERARKGDGGRAYALAHYERGALAKRYLQILHAAARAQPIRRLPKAAGHDLVTRAPNARL